MATRHIAEYPQLLSTISSSQKIVYLCGAGASMSLGAHRLSWSNWILAGKDFLSPSEQIELDKKMGTWTTNELIDAATYFLGQVKSSGSYQTFMDQTIGALHPANETFKDALRKIWRAGDLITTTNYDIQMEETLDAAGISYAAPAEILSVIRGTSDNKVIHLHGMYDRLHGIDDIIADDLQYQEILSNNGAQFIQNLISTYPIVIVGCGGTVEDPNLSGFLSFVVDKLGACDIPYFYLVKNGDTLPSLLANAIPIFYGDDYTDLPAFLSELAVVRLQRRSGLRAVVSVNPYQSRGVATSAFGRMHFANGFNPFVGRIAEMNKLNAFLHIRDKFSWWTVLGEGGIGKSRLVLEWMKTMPSNWFGFFAKKHADAAYQFNPFTDTVVAFDYVLGQERQCAETIAAFLEVFAESPYQLRIVLLERHQQSTDDDWLIIMKRGMPPEARLEFEMGEYQKPILTIGTLNEADEATYIENYLDSYLPLLTSSGFIDVCKANKIDTAKRIQTAYRNSVDSSCLRPLFLSIFIEVWFSKEGQTNFTSAEKLLNEYLNKEKNRWKCILGEDSLVDSYLRLLSVACAIEQFNITDMYGTNYLEEDCRKLISFLDAKSGRPGADNLFEDLFISCSEQKEGTEDASLLKDIFRAIENENQNTVGTESAESLEQDDRFAMITPYIKLQADPQEVYLRMLVNADAATEEERSELEQICAERVQKEKNLPDHAWFIEPCFPDIINEYIVSYSVNERDAERFAKLARSNSILSLANLISLALDDWPENKVFQKIAVTPPDEKLNYFEYYIGLLSILAKVKDIESVEKAMAESDPIFQKYELELWRRIAIVLTDRGNIQRLYDSGLNFIQYVKETAKLTTIRDEVADVFEAYCVGLHNAEAVEKFSAFLMDCYEVSCLLAENKKLGVICCENYGRLMHLRLYENPDADILQDWHTLERILEYHGYEDNLCRIAMTPANEYLHTLVQRKNTDAMCEMEASIAEIYQKCRIGEVAEVAALCLANLYTGESRRKITPDIYEKMKGYRADFSKSMSVRKAFVRISDTFFSQSAEYRRVPDRIINEAKAWAIQYPEEIEFQEGYFDLLFSRLKYAQAQDMRNEQRRVFREMKAVAERADYSQYKEHNQLMDVIEFLQMMYE